MPQMARQCKNFGELKIYWAENYNVKVAEEIAKLDFKSVQEAMIGVETVLKEFPPAMRFLKEFSTYNQGLMTCARGLGIINFNSKYFSDRRRLLSTLDAGVRSGYYHKNMNPFSAGGHEAGHIVEDWLIDKLGGTAGDLLTRKFPQKIIEETYLRLLKTFKTPNEVRTLIQLKLEIAKYSLKNPSECLALVISDCVANQEKATILSRAIWERIKEELN